MLAAKYNLSSCKAQCARHIYGSATTLLKHERITLFLLFIFVFSEKLSDPKKLNKLKDERDILVADRYVKLEPVDLIKKEGSQILV